VSSASAFDFASQADISIGHEILYPKRNFVLPGSTGVASENAGAAGYSAYATRPDRQVALDDVSIYRMPRGSLLLGDRHYLIVGNQIVREQCFSQDLAEVGAYIENAVHQREEVGIDEPTVLVVREGIGTWGHWLAELLPKLVTTEKLFPGKFKFAVLDVYGAFAERSRWLTMQESLLAYGITRDRAILIASDRNYRFSQLYAVASLWDSGFLHPAAGSAMRSELRDQPREGGSSRSFLLRNGDDGRDLTNFDDVLRVLSDRGFVPIQIGTLSFMEQVTIFERSDFVCGVLGSTFTGLLYAPENVAVCTFTHEEFGDEFFYGLTAGRHGRFMELGGKVTERNDQYPRSSNFALDPAMLAFALARLGA
jgi:hypothetical protein